MKYRVIPYKVWEHVVHGNHVSIWGAGPWNSLEDQKNWIVKQYGWTVLNPITGSIGLRRTPFNTQEEAQAYADTHQPITSHLVMETKMNMNAKDLHIQTEKERIEKEFRAERYQRNQHEKREEMRAEERAFMADMMDCL